MKRANPLDVGTTRKMHEIFSNAQRDVKKGYLQLFIAGVVHANGSEKKNQEQLHIIVDWVPLTKEVARCQ